MLDINKINEVEKDFNQAKLEFIDFCARNYTQKRLAEIWNVNQATVSRRLSLMYKMTPSELKEMTNKIMEEN